VNRIVLGERAHRGSLPRALGRGIERASKALALSTSVVAAIAILVAGFLIAFDAASRSLMGRSIPGVFDVIGPLLVIICFLGIARAEVTKNHVRVTLFTGLMPPRVGSAVRAISMLLTSTFLLWMLVNVTEKAIFSFISGEYPQVAFYQLPLWPSRAVVALGVANLLLICLVQTVHHFRDMLNPVADSDKRKSRVEGGFS